MAGDQASQVSVGALSGIFSNQQGPGAITQPVVQCVQIKTLPAQQTDGSDRYRVVFSDIKNFIQTMLATQANHLVTSGGLRRGCFVRLTSYQASQVKGKRILIVLDLEVLEHLGECEKLGEPRPLEIKEEEEKVQPSNISGAGFYGQPAADTSKQANVQRTGMARAAPPSSSSFANIHPIEALSPYSNKWTIKARCTNKSPIKTWHNKNGEGKLFSVNLLDESGEIRATGFNEQCDALYELFQEGGVYYITSPCRVQIAKKQFSNLNNDYELTFERDTQVMKAEQQDGVPQIRFNFTGIGDLGSVDKDTTIDVIGVLKDVAEVSQIVSKTTGKPYDKRELTLVDDSGFSVRLTVWGTTATNFDTATDSTIAFKNVKVSDFGGRSLSLLSSGSMTVNPDIDEAHKLKGWYDAQGRSDTFASHAASAGNSMGVAGGRTDALKTINQIKDENLGGSEDAYFSLKGTIIYIKQENISYPACLSENCNKKVVEIDPDQWRCEKCDKTHPKPEHRYIMSVNVSDHTGQLWLSCFDDVGKLVMGMSADQLMALKDEDEAAATEAFQEANCKTWMFRCRARMDTFQDQQRIRYQVSSATAVNFPQESSRLADLIKSYQL